MIMRYLDPGGLRLPYRLRRRLLDGCLRLPGGCTTHRVFLLRLLRRREARSENHIKQHAKREPVSCYTQNQQAPCRRERERERGTGLIRRSVPVGAFCKKDLKVYTMQLDPQVKQDSSSKPIETS